MTGSDEADALELARHDDRRPFRRSGSAWRGFGTALLTHALGLAPEAFVDANEQASNALPFYEARGFVRIGRSERDSNGRPYPIIHLRYAGAAQLKRDDRQSASSNQR